MIYHQQQHQQLQQQQQQQVPPSPDKRNKIHYFRNYHLYTINTQQDDVFFYSIGNYVYVRYNIYYAF